MNVNVQQVTGTSVSVVQGAATSVDVQAFVASQLPGFEVLTGLGNVDEDFAIFQAALNRTAQQGKGVYIPANEHLKLSDFPIFPDNAILINEGTYENVATSEDYAFQGCLFGLGRIAQSDFWPDPNLLGTVLSVSGHRITFDTVTNASWFASYNAKNGTKQTRVFKRVSGVDSNPAAEVAYIKAAGFDGSNYYIELKDAEDSNLNTDAGAGDSIYAMDTIGVSSGFLNQDGVNVFDLNPARRGKVVTLSASGAGANFSVGEKVFLKTKGNYIARFSSDRAFTPYYSHPDIIEAISGDIITLSIGVHDLGVEIDDLQLCKFTSLRTVSPSHPSGGISPNCAKNIYIGGTGKFIQNVNRSMVAYAAGCMVDVVIDNINVEGGGFTTNGFARSTAKFNSLNSTNTSVSIALGSCDFAVEVDRCMLTKDSGEGSSKTSRSIVFPHENIVNGSIEFNTPIRISNDYPLAVNMLEMDCMKVAIDMAFEVDKNDQGETPSFGNCVQVRSQDPQVLGDARGYHGQNSVKVVGSSPYVAQVIGFADAVNDYLEEPSTYDINYRGAFGEGLVLGANRNQHDIKFNFERVRRVLSVSDFESSADNTIVTFSSGDTRAFADGQSVKFEGVIPANWLNLNTDTYTISRIVSDTQIEIDFDSSGYPNYSGSGSPTMEGAESVSFADADSSSYLNDVVGYCYNAVDVSTSGAVWSLAGGNTFNLDDHKSRKFRGLVARRSLANDGNIGTGSNFEARPASGYQMTTAGILLSGSRYPSLNQFGRFTYVQLSSTSNLLSATDRRLKVGDTFKKVVRGRVYGSYVGTKTIIDSYRWLEAIGDAGFQTFSFDTTITSGDGFEMTTYIRFAASNYIVAWAVFNDGTEQRVETSRVVSVPQASFNNHLIAHFDSSFAPASPYNSEANIVAYEETFEGEAVTGNTKDRITIESIEFSYARK